MKATLEFILPAEHLQMQTALQGGQMREFVNEHNKYLAGLEANNPDEHEILVIVRDAWLESAIMWGVTLEKIEE